MTTGFAPVHSSHLPSLLVAACLVPAMGWTASFQGIGHLPVNPGSGANSAARDLSDDGRVVVGGSTSALAVWEAFHRDATGVVTGLGTLSATHPWSTATDVSGDGATVAGYSYVNELRDTVPFRWTAVDGLVPLGLPDGANTAQTSGISADGATVIGWAIGNRTSPPSYWLGFLWTSAAGFVPLELQPRAIAADGATIGGAALWPERAAALWTAAGGRVLLPHLPGFAGAAEVTALSADGSVVAGHELGNDGVGLAAFRWKASEGVIPLGTMAGLTRTEVHAISGDGAIIVGSAISEDGFSQVVPFIWSEGNGMHPLKDLLLAQGASAAADWTLESASAISADGRFIVGWGETAGDGPGGAWLAEIDGPTAPDGDNDGVFDALDNCQALANADQRDSDGDGYGNRCDADLDNSGGLVNAADLARFRMVFGAADPDADFDGSGGLVNASDLAIFRALFGRAAGPSALR